MACREKLFGEHTKETLSIDGPINTNPASFCFLAGK